MRKSFGRDLLIKYIGSMIIIKTIIKNQKFKIALLFVIKVKKILNINNDVVFFE